MAPDALRLNNYVGPKLIVSYLYSPDGATSSSNAISAECRRFSLPPLI